VDDAASCQDEHDATLADTRTATAASTTASWMPPPSAPDRPESALPTRFWSRPRTGPADLGGFRASHDGVLGNRQLRHGRRMAGGKKFCPIFYGAEPGRAGCCRIVRMARSPIPATAGVGHNPGMHEMELMWDRRPAIRGEEGRARDKPATPGLAVLDFAIHDGARCRSRSGKLVRFTSPRLLKQRPERGRPADIADITVLSRFRAKHASDLIPSWITTSRKENAVKTKRSPFCFNQNR